jgi:hypothetical protein
MQPRRGYLSTIRRAIGASASVEQRRNWLPVNAVVLPIAVIRQFSTALPPMRVLGGDRLVDLDCGDGGEEACWHWNLL